MVLDGTVRLHIWKFQFSQLRWFLMVPLEYKVGESSPVRCDGFGWPVRLHIWKGPIQSSAMILDGSIRERIFGWFLGRVSSNYIGAGGL